MPLQLCGCGKGKCSTFNVCKRLTFSYCGERQKKNSNDTQATLQKIFISTCEPLELEIGKYGAICRKIKREKTLCVCVLSRAKLQFHSVAWIRIAFLCCSTCDQRFFALEIYINYLDRQTRRFFYPISFFTAAVSHIQRSTFFRQRLYLFYIHHGCIFISNRATSLRFYVK